MLQKGGTINILDLRLKKMFISANSHSQETLELNRASSIDASSTIVAPIDFISAASLVALLTSFIRLGVTKHMLPNTNSLIISYFATLAAGSDRRTFLAALRCLSTVQVRGLDIYFLLST